MTINNMNISKVKKEFYKKFTDEVFDRDRIECSEIIWNFIEHSLLTQRKEIIKKIEEMKEDIDYHYCEVDETGYYWGWYHALDDIINQIKK